MNVSAAASGQGGIPMQMLREATQNQEQFLRLIMQDPGRQLLHLAQATEQIDLARQAIASGKSFDARI